ncbi:uncharacterized protein RAG0_16224 [Rhynchosporium agropyri]|uniref:Nephrocystin 3-like N-terminal domain-containing protein n=1 Tax=Rhynchosporium agropyri TaxID=914238 RepID=A0A1E1LPG8_9HELO|nr:uncharacterized protein RAG0_16224 [Rhynchosporium agropyri]
MSDGLAVLINVILLDDLEMCRTDDLPNDVRTDEEFQKLDKKAVELSQRDNSRSELLSWLSSVDPSQKYNDARDKHDSAGEGTGDWLILDNEDFNRWKKASNSLMWLNGEVRQSSNNRKYDSDPQVAIAYFYFSFNDGQKQSVNGQRPDLETLQKVLLTIILGFSAAYVIIDALDECPDLAGDREKLLKSLNLIHQKDLKNIHLFLTSRREEDIETSYRSIEGDSERTDIDLMTYKPAVDHDIGLLIDSTLATNSYKSWPEVLKAEARRDLIQKSDGMFQYIACQFEALQRLKTPVTIRKALKEFTKGLDATYGRMLARILPEDREQAARVLEWLCFSLRPLLVEEVAEGN